MFCEFCFTHYYIKHQKCPTCAKALDNSCVRRVTAQAILNAIASIKVLCPMCKKVFTRSELLEHHNKCFQQCKFCEQKFPSPQVKDHEAKCLAKCFVCDNCSATVKLSDKEIHAKQYCPTACALGCGARISPVEQTMHEATSCSYATVPCASKDDGCTWTGLRKDLSAHTSKCFFIKTAQKMVELQQCVTYFQELLDGMPTLTFATSLKRHLESGGKLAHAWLPKRVLSNIDFSGCDLSCSFVSHADLNGSKLCQAIVRHADLSHAKLDNCDLRKADLTGANLTNATLRNAILEDTILKDVIAHHADFSDAKLCGAKLPSDLSTANLNGCDFTNVNLHGINFSSTSLSNSRLRGCSITDSDMSNAILDGCDFTDAVLTDVNLGENPMYGIVASPDDIWNAGIGTQANAFCVQQNGTEVISNSNRKWTTHSRAAVPVGGLRYVEMKVIQYGQQREREGTRQPKQSKIRKIGDGASVGCAQNVSEFQCNCSFGFGSKIGTSGWEKLWELQSGERLNVRVDNCASSQSAGITRKTTRMGGSALNKCVKEGGTVGIMIDNVRGLASLYVNGVMCDTISIPQRVPIELCLRGCCRGATFVVPFGALFKVPTPAAPPTTTTTTATTPIQIHPQQQQRQQH